MVLDFAEKTRQSSGSQCEIEPNRDARHQLDSKNRHSDSEQIGMASQMTSWSPINTDSNSKLR